MEINICKHEIDPNSIVYDKRYGRSGICKFCGCKLFVTNFYNPKKKGKKNGSR